MSTPLPLGRSRSLPAFPTKVLPGWLAAQVEAVSEATQTPADLAAMVTLGVLSGCAGGRAVVEARAGWREPVNTFTVVALAPGNRKSAVHAAMTAPVLDVEADLVEVARASVVEARTDRQVAEQTAANAKQAAGRADPDQRDALRAEASAAAMVVESMVVPSLPRLFCDDATPEAVASLLAEQGGRVAVLSAEGGIVDTLAGRYSGGVPNLDAFLKGHAGDPLRIDRKGRPPEYVRSPALTVSVTVQPSVLQTMGRHTVFAGRGLLARFLYSLPASTVGSRKVGAAPVPEAVAADYAARVADLARTLAGWTDPAVLTLTPEAGQVLLDFERDLEPRLGPTGDLHQVADWGTKLAGATVRVAGLLHLAAHPVAVAVRQSITADTMAGAVQVARYLTAHALAAFDAMGADPILDDARTVLDHLAARHVESFTRRDLFTALSRSRFRTVAALDPALAVLAEHGWITPQDTPKIDGPGRPPSPTYNTHLATYAAQTAEPAETLTPGHSADCADNAATIRRAS